MAAPAGIAGITFVSLAAQRVVDVQAVLDRVIAAEGGVLRPIVYSLAVLYVGIQFLLVMHGDVGVQRFTSAALRVLIIAFLVGHNANFVHWIEEPVFNRIPRAIAAMVGGVDVIKTLPEQMDGLAANGDIIVADVAAKANSWFSMDDWFTNATAKLSNLLFQIVLFLIFGLYLLSQTFLAIILALGMPALLFELFSATRGFFIAWCGKIVGMIAFGFGTAVVLQLQMQGLKDILNAAHTAVNTSPADASGIFLHIVGNSALDLLTLAALPSIVAFGSGAVAGMAAPSAVAAMRTLSVGPAVAGAAARAVSSGARAARASGSGSNSIGNKTT